MNWEFDFLYLLQSLRNPILDSFMVSFTRLGDAGIIWIAIAIMLLFFKDYRRCGITMLLSLSIMILVGNGVMKNVFMRERPCWIDTDVVLLIKNPTDYSFPSGHTYASFTSAFTIFLYFKKGGIPYILLACLIAFTRLYLFVHYPTDVLVSVVLGIGTAILSYKLVNKYYDKLSKSEAIHG